MTESPPPDRPGSHREPLRAQTRITVDDPHIMVKLPGAGDEILRLVERSVTSDVHVRGNEITITGAPADNALAERIFAELLELIEKGETLTADAVRRTVGMIEAGTAERPAEVLTLNILSRRGRTIRPKTLGQKRYVDAIDAHTIVFGIGPAGTGKTYLGMAKAVQALQAKQVNRIILTRLGFGSKIVVTGDVTQVDLPGGTRSGLRIVREILDGLDDVHFSVLTSADVVRHRLVSDIVDAYARWDAAQQPVHAVPGRTAQGGRTGRRR